MNTDKIRLTAYSKAAGCGCKIAPQVLQEILKTDSPPFEDPNLLVGNEHSDDAAVYDLGNGQALISTTDFFTPIVDDAFDFGSVAAANAISDVYAMGGRPLMAIAILGWPLEKLPATEASRVLDGARKICADAGITLAGGHSIESDEPIFGLSVTGIVAKANIRTNAGAKEGDLIYLTKPLGSGILSTAAKKSLIDEEDHAELIQQLAALNKQGEVFSTKPYVHAITDVTGFGLAGHLKEMAIASSLSAEIFYSNIPVLDSAKKYLAQNAVPDATYRNWNAYGKDIAFEKGVNVMEAFKLLPDPQTNGGLLVAIDPLAQHEFEQLLEETGLPLFSIPIGKFIPKEQKIIRVLP